MLPGAAAEALKEFYLLPQVGLECLLVFMVFMNISGAVLSVCLRDPAAAVTAAVTKKSRVRRVVSVRKRGNFEVLEGCTGTAELAGFEWSAAFDIALGSPWSAVLRQKDVFFATGALELKVDCWVVDEDPGKK